MNAKQRKTLSAIFDDPINGNIEWRRIESLLETLGCQVIEGSEFHASPSFSTVSVPIYIALIQIRKHCAIASKTCVYFCKEQVSNDERNDLQKLLRQSGYMILLTKSS